MKKATTGEKTRRLQVAQAKVHATSQTTEVMKNATTKENDKKKRPQVIQAERKLQELQAKLLIISQEIEELTNATTKDIESSKSMRSNAKRRSKQKMCLDCCCIDTD